MIWATIPGLLFVVAVVGSVHLGVLPSLFVAIRGGFHTSSVVQVLSSFNVGSLVAACWLLLCSSFGAGRLLLVLQIDAILTSPELYTVVFSLDRYFIAVPRLGISFCSAVVLLIVYTPIAINSYMHILPSPPIYTAVAPFLSGPRRRRG